MNALNVDRIAVRYEDNLALDGFSLEVARGEIMAVVGPSGSGKSTLLRAIAGLEPLVAGSIALGGQDLAGVATHRRNLGMMFQDHGLFTHLSVSDNIGYGLKTAGVDKASRRTREAELLDLVGLSGFGDRRTDELSGGEGQRVALARALALEPGLLMLDEPLGSLDRALRDQLIGELRRLLTSLGQTALHVTHDQAEAFAIADRVAVVGDGSLVTVGSPAELWSNPGTTFVAEFLGHQNIITVAVEADGSVAWSGRDLGRLPTGHRLRSMTSAESVAVLPTTALRVETNSHSESDSERAAGVGSLDVVVVESVFRAGMHDVAAAVVDAGEGATLHFTTATAVTVGQGLSLLVNADLLAPLID